MRYYYYLLLIIIIILVIWFFQQDKPPEFIGLTPLSEYYKTTDQPPTSSNVGLDKPTNEDNNLPLDNTGTTYNESPSTTVVHNIRKSKIRQMLGPTAKLLQMRKDYLTNNKLSARALSEGEFLCQITLETIFQTYFTRVEPDFLKSTLTAKNLQLDGYSETLQLAFEYNGEQHYKFPNFWHKSYDQFIRQVQNDRYKKTLCLHLGITLLIIPYTVPNGEIPEYIAALLPPEFDKYRYDLL